MTREYTVADALLDTLKAHGVTHLFGYPGGAILPFYDALPSHPEIKHVLVRHEQAAAFAAQGWARSTKQIGVCCATSGPGGTNLVTGIADAYMDSIPILCITGQVPLEMIGKDMFQEVDMTGITLNITKHNYLVDKAENIVPIVTEAIQIALSGRPGPVHIDIPKNIQAAPHPRVFDIPKIDLSEREPTTQAFEPLNGRVLDEVMRLLKEAKRPMLLLGQGIKHSGADALADDFIQTLGIPTVTTLLAKGVVNLENPYYLGMLGMHGFYESNMGMHHADLILNIGSRFDDRIVGRYDAFGKNAKIIHVDVDSAELGKIVRADLPIHSDAKLFLQQLMARPELTRLSLEPWWEQLQKWKQAKPYHEEMDRFTMRACLASMRELIEQDPDRYILVTDVGQHQMWASLSTNVKSSFQWLTSGGAGTMGFALPTAMGAAMAHPDKTVLCITGDGGIQMNIQEFGTIADHRLNIKVCILNNFFLGMVRQWQELFYENNYSSVAITSPNYEKLAEAYGIEGMTFKSVNDLAQQSTYFDRPGPVVLDYHVEKETNVFPMVPGGKTLGETISD